MHRTTHDPLGGRARGSTHRLSSHPFLSSPDAPDEVIHACMWSDGGAEFIFFDGTVLSFRDEMATFVALRQGGSPRVTSNYFHSHSTNHTKAFTHRQTNSLVPTGVRNTNNSNSGNDRISDEMADDNTEREMFVTAWTVSTYTAKVRAALMLYNRYSPHPRLIEGLLPCEGDADDAEDEWGENMHNEENHWAAPHARSEADRHTVLLAEDRCLLERYHVGSSKAKPAHGPCHAHADAEEESCVSSSYSLSSSVSSSSVSCVHSAERGEDDHHHHHDDDEEEKDSTELTLWCAERRVRLTLHPSRLFFTVCWPAPVSPAPAPALSFLGSTAELPNSSRLSLSSTSSISPRHLWLEQTFPTDAAPPEWQSMLQLIRRIERSCHTAAVLPSADMSQYIVAQTRRAPIARTTAPRPPPPHDTFFNAAQSTHQQQQRQQKQLRCLLPRSAVDRVKSISVMAMHNVSSIQTHHRRRMTQPSVTDTVLFSPARCADCHAAGAQVMWRYDAEGGSATGRPPYSRLVHAKEGEDAAADASCWQPGAVYWFIPQSSASRSTSSSLSAVAEMTDASDDRHDSDPVAYAANRVWGDAGVSETSAVVAVVHEDESVVHVQNRRRATECTRTAASAAAASSTFVAFASVSAEKKCHSLCGADLSLWNSSRCAPHDCVGVPRRGTCVMRHWRGGEAVRCYHIADPSHLWTTRPLWRALRSAVRETNELNMLPTTHAPPPPQQQQKLQAANGVCACVHARHTSHHVRHAADSAASLSCSCTRCTAEGAALPHRRRPRASAFPHRRFSRIADYEGVAFPHRGRYLAAVSRSCVELVDVVGSGQERCMAGTESESLSLAAAAVSQRYVPSATATERTVDRRGAAEAGGEAAGCGTTELPGVGCFTVMQDGRIRCVFADRTVLTIACDEASRRVHHVGHVCTNQKDSCFASACHRGAAGRHMTCLFRDARRLTVPLTQKMTPSHPIFPYAMYALAFLDHVEGRQTTATATAEAVHVPSAPTRRKPSSRSVALATRVGDGEMQGRDGTEVSVRDRPAGSVVDADEGGTCMVEAVLERSSQLARRNRALLRAYVLECDEC